VWTDERSGYNDIYAQKIDGGGKAVWDEGGIPVCLEPRNQSAPQIISDGSGGAIMVWEDYRTGSADIYAQKILGNGKLAWGSEAVKVCSARAAQRSPKIATDGSGGAIITWYDYRSGKGEDIYAQALDPSGKSRWKKDGVSVSVAAGTQWYPEIISDGSGGAIIVWTDFRSGKGSDIYGQRIGADGSAIWQKDGLPVCFAEENQAYPKMTTDGSGGAIIAWDDFRNDNFDIFVQGVNKNGRPMWGVNGKAVASSDGNEERPSVTFGPGGGAIVSWISRVGDSSSIFAQMINSSGEALWDESGVLISSAQGKQESQKIVTSTDGGAVVAWEDLRSGRRNIYAQKISDGGIVLWGLDGVPICMMDSDCELPDMAVDKSGGTKIVWQDLREGNFDIYAQSVGLDGSLEWGARASLINSSMGSVAQQKPKLAYDEDNGHIVIWEDGRSGYSDIFAQKINSSGALMWGKEGLAVSVSQGIQRNPQITYAGEGSVIVVWEDARSGSRWDIYAQKIAKDGSLVWKSDGVRVSGSDSNKMNPSVVDDGQGGAIIAWEEKGKDSRSDIFAQRISSAGRVFWGNKGSLVCSSPSDQVEPVIAGSAPGECVIAWVDYRNGIFNPDIFAQRIGIEGSPLWEEDGVPVCTAPDSQKNPSIVDDGAGGAIISWSDKGGGGYDIYAQRINADGTIKLTVDGVPVCQAPGTQRNPRMVNDGAGGAIIVWNDFRNLNWDIYSQRMSGSGALLWEESGLPICAAPLTQYSPVLVTGGWGTIIAWEDYRNAEYYNIYAQKLNVAGEMLWQKNGVAVCSQADGERNPQIAPNGGGGAVIAWEDYRAGGYGIYAQKIKIIKLD